MQEIVIRIKPSFSDGIDDITRLVAKILDSLDKRENHELGLEAVGEVVLKNAKMHVETGYAGGLGWQPRSGITELLYSLSPYHQGYSPVGMDTGRRKLVGSLERGDEENIWHWEGRALVVGTDFRHASILEKGGPRFTTEDWPSLGLSINPETGEWHIAKWLQPAIDDGVITRQEIINALAGPNWIPARPYMAPAVRKIKDAGVHAAVFARQMEREIIDDYRLRISKSLPPETMMG